MTNSEQTIAEIKAALQDSLFLTMTLHKIRRDIMDGTLTDTQEVLDRIEECYARVGMVMEKVNNLDFEVMEKKLKPVREGIIDG
jgi:hypothetical protein